MLTEPVQELALSLLFIIRGLNDRKTMLNQNLKPQPISLGFYYLIEKVQILNLKKLNSFKNFEL